MGKRTEYVEKLSAEMVEWDIQIERLKETAESTTPELRFEYARTISALQLKRDEAEIKLQGISTASGDEWEEMKSGTEQAWSEISNSLRDAIMKTK